MPNRQITEERLDNFLKDFQRQYPKGDARDLARFMYNAGYESGRYDERNER